MNGQVYVANMMTYGAVMPNWRFTDLLEPHVPITAASSGNPMTLFFSPILQAF